MGEETAATAASRDDGADTPFIKKRQAIIAAAARHINERGVRAMTLAEIGADVGLIKNSLTYYFKRKEDLAVACFLDGIDRLDALVAQAMAAPRAPERLTRLVELYLDLERRARLGEAPTLPIFSDIRALAGANRDVVTERYRALFTNAMKLFSGPGAPVLSRDARITRTHIVLEQLYWSVAWLPSYHPGDHERIAARMSDVLIHGIAQPGASWAPRPLPAQPPPADLQEEAFLRTATRLINQNGYRGASVDQISAELNHTKGSFYHRHDAKSDLAVSCFERSFGIARRLQSASQQASPSPWDQLATAAAALTAFQTSPDGPLLRTSAFSAAPSEARPALILAGSAVTNRYAAMISDAIAAGEARAVDAAIAAQILSAAINAAAEIFAWTPNAPGDSAPELYARPILMGLYAP